MAGKKARADPSFHHSCSNVHNVNTECLQYLSVPKDEQVLLRPEAFRSQEAAAALRQAATPTRPLLRVAVQLRELHQLIVLKGVVVARLLSHPRRVNDQRLL